ncbi:MAG: FG-GAP-like repeat-containing protein [Bacteroidota bacterium]
MSIAVRLLSQQFTPIPTTIPKWAIEYSKWGDYDNDGDLDVLLCVEGILCRNDGMFNFSEIDIGLEGYTGRRMAWGDYDNDGDLDIIETGRYALQIHQNDGNGVFNIVVLSEDTYSFGDVIWFDYDNDGDLDVCASGICESDNLKTVIYRNEGGNKFLEKELSIPGITNGRLSVNDHENDGDIDLFITGRDANGNGISGVYLNNYPYPFTRLESVFCRGDHGTGPWADFTSDGLPDIFVMGWSSLWGDQKGFYMNQIDDYLLLPSEVSFYAMSDGLLGDFDVDGDLDLFFQGHRFPQDTVGECHFFRNDGYGTFILLDSILPGLNDGRASLADIDMDGDLDILRHGYSYSQGSWSGEAEIMRNNATIINNRPNPPIEINYKQIGNNILLSWEPGSDDHTKSVELTYNLRVGTTPDGIEIVSPMSNVFSGEIVVPCLGNAYYNTAWILKDLPPGIYYWSVQTIDNSYNGSVFSKTDTFVVKERFEKIQEFGNLNYGHQDWGDYDGDGDLDFAMTGMQMFDSSSISAVFSNQGLISFEPYFELTETLNGSVLWGDYDNDNDLDLISAGYAMNEISNRGESFLELFKNNEDSFERIQLQIEEDFLVHMNTGDYLEWGDSDNDGDLDFLISNSEQIFLYENLGNDFFKVILEIASGQRTAWGDYDNDYDLDLLCKSGLYENIGKNRFIPRPDLMDMNRIQIQDHAFFFDYNNDNSLDLLMSGLEGNGDRKISLYANQIKSGGEFILTDYGIRGIENGAISFGDYNCDGIHDLIVCGFSGWEINKMYMGNSNYIYEENELGIRIKSNSIEAADFDNDLDLDFFAIENSPTGVFRNNGNWPNTPPGTPSNLRSRQNGYGIIVEWDSSEDLESKFGGLNYNIRIGRTPGGCEIQSPMSDLTTGFRYIPQMGNANMNLGWRIDSLPVGSYYWSVQAIDHCFIGGSWANEQTFDIEEIVVDFISDTVCEGLPVQFLDNSLVRGEAVDSWNWDFGGGSSNNQNPQYIFQTDGSHDVTLTVTRGEESFFKTKQIYVKPSPEVQFVGEEVCLGALTSFQNQSSVDGLMISNWNWDFDDGITSSTRDPQPHGFVNPGTYNVRLIAEADNGCSDSISKVVSVLSKPEKDLTAEGTPCADQGFVLKTADSPSYSYQWKYQGTDITDANQSSYQPDRAGDYSVVVTSLCGEVSASYTVEEPSISIFGEGIPCEGSDYVLKTLERESYTYQWRLHGVDIEGANQATHHPAKPGEYSVAVQTPCGEFTSSYNVGFLVGPPKPELYVRGPNVWYLACSNDSADIYQWYKDDVEIPGAEDPVFVPNDQMGIYQVRISDGSECFTYSDPVRIPNALTGIEEDPFAGLKIYPNPTPGVFNIEMDNPTKGELVIDVYSEQGSKILNIKILKETSHLMTKVDLSGQPKGAYHIGIILDRYMSSQTLLIK